MNATRSLFTQLEQSFRGSRREVVSAHYSVVYHNAKHAKSDSSEYFDEIKTEILINRMANELHFHNFLNHQLFYKLQEIKYYSAVNIENTRRLVAVSTDCITSIHLIIRNCIHLNVYFRSSDYDGALPADYKFLATIPSLFIDHLTHMQDVDGYDEVNDSLLRMLTTKTVQVNLMFGSLHRTN